MTEFTKPPESPFVREMRRVNAAQQAATTPEDREAADAEMALLLRYIYTGRFDEYVARKAAQEPSA